MTCRRWDEDDARLHYAREDRERARQEHLAEHARERGLIHISVAIASLHAEMAAAMHCTPDDLAMAIRGELKP